MGCYADRSRALQKHLRVFCHEPLVDLLDSDVPPLGPRRKSAAVPVGAGIVCQAVGIPWKVAVRSCIPRGVSVSPAP